ncbi:tRNA (adenine(37)-N6)-methyltransferase [Protopterus annectens]|uniref:tRNA (adenine(37)-N6)-methyltransferase n=1 Tax=Protopterus annectens TaxID=7888 RepID=UPI001CFA4331|nr:tRNA (adenine(37)-N6)-methyltransferase [Protopterus annectens]
MTELASETATKCVSDQELAKKTESDFAKSLEKGRILTEPVGYIESCFTEKNGTPRQPAICSLSRACLKIQKSVFNNPEHSLIGLEQFSHVWLLFVFHKNGHLSSKAKVKPPRLNGAKTGVFSTRSPHRPNAIGLTLAKLENVEGGTLYLSGIDMIDGTPVLDIKPYIADYDCPSTRDTCCVQCNRNKHIAEVINENMKQSNWESKMCTTKASQHCSRNTEREAAVEAECICRGENLLTDCQSNEEWAFQRETAFRVNKCTSVTEDITRQSSVYQNTSLAYEDLQFSQSSNGFTDDFTEDTRTKEEEMKKLTAVTSSVPVEDECTCTDEIVKDSFSQNKVAHWIHESPVTALTVRFTPHADLDLGHFQGKDGKDAGKATFKFLHSPEEAKHAIMSILSADPRSVYRRKQCEDQLYYFTLDCAHITCWFGEDFAEVLRIKPLIRAQNDSMQ